MQSDFKKTEEAFAKLDSSFERLENIAEKKREQLKQRQSNADQRLSAECKKNTKIKASAENLSLKVENIINNLNRVIQENGTSNSNN